MCRQLITLVVFISITWPTLGFSAETLLKLNVLGYSLGLGGGEASGPDLRLEMLSFGYGQTLSSGLGVLVETKLVEGFGTYTFGPDPTESSSMFPIYLHLTSGLHSRKRLTEPVTYAYAGGSGWTADDEDYLRLGAGLKWTFWAVSLAGELSWRAVRDEAYDRGSGHERHWHGMFSFGITLELGGWWAESRKENEEGLEKSHLLRTSAASLDD